jgi:alpha-tubulin suppressor-like RCC1 family protein
MGYNETGNFVDLKNIISISCGYYHTLVIDKNDKEQFGLECVNDASSIRTQGFLKIYTQKNLIQLSDFLKLIRSICKFI